MYSNRSILAVTVILFLSLTVLAQTNEVRTRANHPLSPPSEWIRPIHPVPYSIPRYAPAATAIDIASLKNEIKLLKNVIEKQQLVIVALESRLNVSAKPSDK